MSSAVIQVQFQGVEEGIDPKSLPPGTLKTACNYRMLKGRRLEKRKGTVGLLKSVFGGGSLGEGLRLQTRGKDIIMPSGEYSCAYSTDLSKFQLIGRPSTLRITKRGFVDSTRSAVATDCALWGTNLLVSVTLSGYRLLSGHSARDSVLHYAIENIETGQKVLPATFLRENATWARVSVSGNFAMVTSSSIAGEISVFRIDLTTFAVTSMLLDTTAPDGSPCDSGITIHPSEGVAYGYVAWVPTGADKLKVSKFRLSDFGNLSSVTLMPASAWTPQSVSIAPTTNGIFVMSATSLSSNSTLWNLNASTLATTVGPVNLAQSLKFCSVQDYDTNNVLVMVTGSDPANTTPHKLETYLCPKSTLVKNAASWRVTWHVLAMTKAWKLNNRWYTLASVCPRTLNLTSGSPIPNASSVILEIETATTTLTSVNGSPNPHMGTAESMTGWFPTQLGYVPQAITRTVNGSTLVHVPAAYRNREPMNFQSIPIGWNLYTIESNAADTHRLAVVANGALSAAGAPYWLDGASSRPYGFCVAPMILGLSADTTGGFMLAGTYTYVAVYEWRDANGVLHRSPPSPPLSVTTTGSTSRVKIDVTSASVSQHQSPPYAPPGGSFAADPNAACSNPVSIALYRTTVNGSDYYRLTLEPEFQILINDPTVGPVSLQYDTKADADIGSGSPARPLATQPQLYTGANGTGGELEDIAPPSFLTVITNGGRFVGLGPDKRTLWFSKDATEDQTVAPGFNEVLTLGFATDKVALGSLDDKLIVFGETTIDIVYGKGPDATGSGSAWEVQRLQTDVGCVNPRSVATIPAGVVFESPRGIELLTRELTVVWLGKSVEDTLGAYPTITSAVSCPEDHEVRFTCNGASTGIVLAYDYANKIWFTRKYKDVLDSTLASVKLADAALIGGVYHVMTSNGQIYYETEAHALDSGSDYVETELALAPISFSGQNLEEQRVKDVSVQGTSLTKHKLEVSQKRDYASAWESPVKVFTSPVTDPGPFETCRRTFPQQRCISMEVRLRELAPTNPADYGTGKGAILEGLTFRVQTKRGLHGTAKEQQG